MCARGFVIYCSESAVCYSCDRHSVHHACTHVARWNKCLQTRPCRNCRYRRYVRHSDAAADSVDRSRLLPLRMMERWCRIHFLRHLLCARKCSWVYCTDNNHAHSQHVIKSRLYDSLLLLFFMVINCTSVVLAANCSIAITSSRLRAGHSSKVKQACSITFSNAATWCPPTWPTYDYTYAHLRHTSYTSPQTHRCTEDKCIFSHTYTHTVQSNTSNIGFSCVLFYCGLFTNSSTSLSLLNFSKYRHSLSLLKSSFFLNQNKTQLICYI